MLRSAFVAPSPQFRLTHKRLTCGVVPKRARRWACHGQQGQVRMNISIGKPSVYVGVAILAAVLTNRIVFTPLDSLAMTQSRSDILGVITGATLLLYGVGKVEISDTKEAVEMDGVDLRLDASPSNPTIEDQQLKSETEWAANAIFKNIPNICSLTLVNAGRGRFFYGRFRSSDVDSSLSVPDGGIISNAMATGQRAYLADMKVVPVKETEFGFLPKNCQAVVVQPISENAAVVLGADKPRPLTGSDFGWIQAIANRIGNVLESTSPFM